MFDLSSYKQEIKGLYRKLCENEKLAKLHMKSPLGFSATVWGDLFVDANPRVLFLGKANNGATVAKLRKDSNAIDADELFEGTMPIMLDDGTWMNHFHDQWDKRNRCGWCPNRSQFFRVLRRTSEMLCDKCGWPKADWHRYVAYGNFMKCNLDCSSSPSTRVLDVGEGIFVEMLKVDLKHLKPDFTVCFTGSGDTTRWFSNLFLKPLGAVEIETIPWAGDSRYCIRVNKIQDRYFIVTEHPMQKPEEAHAETISSAIDKYCRGRY